MLWTRYINKVKSHKCYEFVVKSIVAMPNRSKFAMDGLEFLGNSYDDHRLSIQLIQVKQVTVKNPKEMFVNHDYHGHGLCVSKD